MNLHYQMAHDFAVFVVILPIIMYFIGKYLYQRYCIDKPRYYWYLLVFYNPVEHTFYKSFRGFNKNQISLRNIVHIKQQYNLVPGYMLLHTSYLGYMTKDEFIDKDTLKLLNIEINTH